MTTQTISTNSKFSLGYLGAVITGCTILGFSLFGCGSEPMSFDMDTGTDSESDSESGTEMGSETGETGEEEDPNAISFDFSNIHCWGDFDYCLGVLENLTEQPSNTTITLLPYCEIEKLEQTPALIPTNNLENSCFAGLFDGISNEHKCFRQLDNFYCYLSINDLFWTQVQPAPCFGEGLTKKLLWGHYETDLGCDNPHAEGFGPTDFCSGEKCYGGLLFPDGKEAPLLAQISPLCDVYIHNAESVGGGVLPEEYCSP